MPDALDLPDIPLEQSTPGCLLKSALAACQDLNLPALGADRWVIRKQPWDDSLKDKTPFGTICIYRPRFGPDDGTTGEDDTKWAIMISAVLASNRDLTTNGLGLQLLWSEQIIKAFQNKNHDDFTTLPPNPGDDLWRVTVEDGTHHIDEAFRRNLDAQYWLTYWTVRNIR